MKRKFKKVIYTILFFSIILFASLLFDYGNFLYFISKNLNYDFLNIFIPNIVIIFIFLITYFLVDGKNIEKEEKISKNQLNVLNIMMYETFIT